MRALRVNRQTKRKSGSVYGLCRGANLISHVLEMRADRLATLYLFHPLRRLQPERARIPILMYHSISEPGNHTRHPYFQTTTNPAVFEGHLRYLHENGYLATNLTNQLSASKSPGRSVVITFDDGFQDFYTHAFPLLSKYRYSATVFLPTAFIGETTSRHFNDTACMTWGQIRELQSAGIQFGSHTVTHPQLRMLSTNDLQGEVRCSKETIEDKLSCPVNSFAYPYAFPQSDCNFKRRLRSILEDAGYENGVCTSIGSADPTGDPFFLKRLPVNSCDDVRFLRAKLEGGYDWLGALQYAAKLRPSHLLRSKIPTESIF